MERRMAPGAEPNVTITPVGVSDPAARFMVFAGAVWFIAWCVAALVLLRDDWPTADLRLPVGIGALVVLLLSGFGIAVRLRRLDAGVRESYAEALAQTNALLRELVDQDDLTELRNRRYFVRRLEEEFARSQRTGASFALLIADLDGFKQVNDQFGHQCGDRVLKEFARRLQGAMDERDVICRIGGDEFAVIAPDTDAVRAEALCERIHALDTDMPPWDAGVSGPTQIRASVGKAMFEPSIQDASAQLTRADQALYAAKRQRALLSPEFGEGAATS
jgi:diguanylate cyclase (GGDEF)-like protein